MTDRRRNLAWGPSPVMVEVPERTIELNPDLREGFLWIPLEAMDPEEYLWIPRKDDGPEKVMGVIRVVR